MTYRKLSLLIVAVVMGLHTAKVLAQDAAPAAPRKATPRAPRPEKPTDNGKPRQTSSTTIDITQMPTQATVEMIMNEAVKNISKRYNLNEAQKLKTDEIMKREVNKFLKEHEAEVWPIIRDLISNGFNAPSDPEAVRRIGKAADPLVKAAREAIYKGNDEWRQYLTPEQKVMHDFDMSEMDTQFAEVERNFRSWAEGKPPPGSLFPAPNMDRSPTTPPRPPEGHLPKPPPPPEPEIEIFVRESLFDSYVEDFIKQYQLDAAQIDAARSILAEFKQKANDFKESNRTELTRIAMDYKSATDSKDRDAMAKAEAQRKKLLQPVYELFSQMDERLKALLTTAQMGLQASNAKARNPLEEPAANPPLASPPAGSKKADDTANGKNSAP